MQLMVRGLYIVGKHPNHHSMPQEDINALLVALAQKVIQSLD